MFSTVDLGRTLATGEPETHLTQVTVKISNPSRPHELQVTLDGGETLVVLPSLCLAPIGAQVWMVGKGPRALIIGPGQWIDFVPVLSQGASGNIAKTVSYSKFLVEGYKCTWAWEITATASGTAGSNVSLTFPIPPAFIEPQAGTYTVVDTSTGIRYTGHAEIASTTSLVASNDVGATGGIFGTTPNVAIANGDVLRGVAIYQID